jgi:predicted PurR-regulated permease PerM
MNTTLENEARQPWPQVMLDVLLRAGLMALLVVFCFQIFRPFLNLMLWAIILAVTLYPLHVRLRDRIGRSDGRTATVIVLLAMALLAVPIWLVTESVLESVMKAMAALEQGRLHVPAPKASVAEWPVVGERLHAAWQAVAADPHLIVEKLGPSFRHGAMGLLAKFAGVATAFLLFYAALAVAGIFLAWGAESAAAAGRVATWLVGRERGPELVALCAATVRAVAQGVVGIAFIQALLVGVALVLLPVKGAALLTLVILLLGIIQLPATIVTIPIIAVVLSTQGANTGTIVFAIYVFIAGLADNVLKPLLLGRGVDVPMPVVLIGAIGGMISNGLIGLFIGPVVLGVAYQLFWRWVDERAAATPVTAPVVVPVTIVVPPDAPPVGAPKA